MRPFAHLWQWFGVFFAGVLAMSAVTAQGYFAASGRATGSASVGTLQAPGSVTAQVSGSAVQIGWSTARLSSGQSATGYRVVRSDSVAICGASVPVSGLSCTDSAPSLGATYAYTVTAVYGGFTTSATSAALTVLVAPTISSKPSNPSASIAPSFSFSGGGGTGYSCRLDSGSWQACASGVSYASLVNGSHSFAVHATSGGATGADATYTWTVDATAPSVTSDPPNPSANTTGTFTYQHPQSAYTFQCRLDAGAWSSCSNVGTSFSSLSNGSHTFQVRALGADGASTAATSYAWTIDTSAPSITAHPANPSTLSTASFSFAHAQSAYTFSCQIDGGSWSSCTSSKSYALGDGSHTFAVRAIDSASYATGSASFTWLIDTSAPTNAITLTAASGAYLNGSTLYFSSSVAGSFKLTDTVADVGSGPASVTYPALSGVSNWATHTTETVSGASPYTSSLFSWSSSAATPANYTITSKDAAGNTSAGATLGFVADASVDGTGSLTVAGQPASSGGASTSTTNTGFTIGARTDYTDSLSGIASATLTVQSETLSAGSCGTAGSGGPFTSATVISGTTQPGGIAAGYCYLYKLTGTDRVGNTASVSVTVKLTSSPTVIDTNPSGLTQGQVSKDVLIDGTAFLSGATASFSGSGITINSTTFNSATQLKVNLTVAAGASTGTRNLTVTNPDGGTVTANAIFTVTAPLTVTGATALTQNLSGQTLTITGTGFVSGSGLAVSLSGSGFAISTVTVQSTTKITATVSTTGLPAPGTHDVTVTNGDGNGPITCAGCTHVYSFTDVASSSTVTSGNTVTTNSFTWAANTAYVVFAFVDCPTSNPYPNLILWQTTGLMPAPSSPMVGYVNFGGPYWNEQMSAGYLTGGGGSGTLITKFQCNPVVSARVDVIAVGGANPGAPIVASTQNFSLIGTSPTASAALAGSGVPAKTDDAELVWWGASENDISGGPTTSVLASLAGSYAGTSTGSTKVFGGPASTSAISLSMASSAQWGTATLEVAGQ